VAAAARWRAVRAGGVRRTGLAVPERHVANPRLPRRLDTTADGRRIERVIVERDGEREEYRAVQDFPLGAMQSSVAATRTPSASTTPTATPATPTHASSACFAVCPSPTRRCAPSASPKYKPDGAASRSAPSSTARVTWCRSSGLRHAVPSVSELWLRLLEAYLL
jgi:hypothetical protein